MYAKKRVVSADRKDCIEKKGIEEEEKCFDKKRFAFFGVYACPFVEIATEEGL